MRKSPACILLAVALCLGACTDDDSGVEVTDTGLLDTHVDDTGAGDAGSGDAVSDATEVEDATDTDVADVDTPPELPPRPWDVTEPGPYNIGYRVQYITYTPRGDAEEERTLRVVFWYPTFDQEGRPARYASILRRDTIFDRAALATDEPLPVLIFSHGNTSMAEQSFFMTEFFASHGWLVVAPDHTGNTIANGGEGISLGTAPLRPQDLSAVLDTLENMPEDDLLYGSFSDDIIVSGHSFGGFTTLASAGAGFAVDELLEDCESGAVSGRFCNIYGPDTEQVFREGFLDERFKVALPQTPAGALAFRDGLAEISMPTLLWTGALDRSLPNVEEGDPIWEAMSGPQHMRIDLTTAGHFTFSNMCDLLGSFPEVGDDGCGEGFIDAHLAFQAINAYSMAFARFHLFGDTADADLLDGSRKLVEDMIISRKE